MFFKPSVLISLLFLGAPTQTPLAPKQGLWEVSVESSASGTEVSKGTPLTAVAQRCITSELWAKSFGTNKPVLEKIGCTLSNEKRTATHWGADVACPDRGMRARMDVDLISPEAVHMIDSTRISMNGNKLKQKIVMNYKFLNDSCGSLKPEEPTLFPQ